MAPKQDWYHPLTNYFEYFSLAAILLTGAFLRLWRIREYMTFLGDEGRDVLIVKRMIVDHDITFLGPTASVGGFFLGPIYYYFITPFLWAFNLDPVGPAVMVALFGIATIGLVYIAGKHFYSTTAALVASSLFAVSPVVIAYSRSSWNPNIVPFFSLLFVYSLSKAVETHKKKWYFIAGSCIGIGLQLHYLFTFLIPVGVVFVLLYDRDGKRRIIQYAFALAGCLAWLMPFIGFEIKNRFPNTLTIYRFISAGKEVAFSGNPLSTVSGVVFRLFARLIFKFPPSEQLSIELYDMDWWWRTGIIVAVVVTIAYALYRVFRFRKQADVLVGLWLLFGAGLFGFYQKAIYDYYFVIMFGLPFLLFGSLISICMNNRFVKWVSIAAVAVLLWFNWNGRPFIYPPNRQIEQVERIAREIYTMSGGRPYNFGLVTNGNSDHAYRFFLESWGHPPVTIENPDIDPPRQTVTDQLVVLCEFPTCQPLGHPLWEIAGFGQAEIDQELDIGLSMKVFRLVHANGKMIQ